MPLIGSVPYLNARPLLDGLDEIQPGGLILKTPAGLHEAITKGEIEVALLPVVSYLELPDLRLIPGTGIACHGPVQSVKIFFEDPKADLHNVESIALDPDSKTSNRLLKVLLAKKYHRDLEEIQFSTDPEHAQAVLKIGDRALAEAHFGNSFDLGQEWVELTGLPFVFACWMSAGPITPELLTHLHNAKMRGIQKLHEIALAQEIIAPDDALIYLKDHIKYDIHGPDLIGLKLFFDWVGELENQAYDTSLRFVA